MAVSVTPSGERLSFSAPQKLFPTGLRVSAIQDQFAVAPDGRFLVSQPVIAAGQERVTVVINWPARLRQATAAK